MLLLDLRNWEMLFQAKLREKEMKLFGMENSRLNI